MATVAFTKVEGLGNDFLLVDRRDLDEAGLDAEIERLRAHARQLCDRRRGVGGDGILVVGGPRGEAQASMTVINFDGSRPEMCGNGLRCVAAHVAHALERDWVDVDTDAGVRRCERIGDDVRVDMGPARSLGDRRPASGGGRRFVGVSMGNPHAVRFVDADEDPESLAREQGPEIERDPAYRPTKTNVEFARVQTDGSVLLWVWERGVGITEACGTGACATAAAAVAEGLLPAGTDVRVHLPGGALTIQVPADPGAGIQMTGPARVVFVGSVELEPR